MAIIQNYKINLVIMITYVLMMMITEFLVINTSKWWDPFVSIPFNTLFYVAVSWVICLLVSFTGKTISKYIHVLLHVVIFSYTISNIFLSVVFHRHWDAFTLQFLRETNLREATEFMAQVRKSVDSPPGMLTEDHHHTVHEESQVCYSSHLRPKSLHL